MPDRFHRIFAAENGLSTGSGPLYLRLRNQVERAISDGLLSDGDALPSERDIADLADVSRVTVRKAVQDLVKDGVLVQRHGSGTFVSRPAARVEQPLSRLTSFTEDMSRRGWDARSEWLQRGVFVPSPEEMVTLGLAPGDEVVRIDRLRIADDRPLAIERASISTQMLPDPDEVETSLYAALDVYGFRPVRALQRISATNLRAEDAELLDLDAGDAGLRIERISYLESGRVVEFTRSLYRGDAYDFVAELTIGKS
ncbi:GntR family transcriptional regulator [Nitratireductor sp. XY-223]|uniref:GntR family transcriptional regulator n=1 Tax=Nitratireductor sp. XY-223 TaxID=2561926 RepID=UPI0010A9AF00|nr:GntR family transcriptional regulator [Nitratireductor sp. XY-223]